MTEHEVELERMMKEALLSIADLATQVLTAEQNWDDAAREARRARAREAELEASNARYHETAERAMRERDEALVQVVDLRAEVAHWKENTGRCIREGAKVMQERDAAERESAALREQLATTRNLAEQADAFTGRVESRRKALAERVRVLEEALQYVQAAEVGSEVLRSIVRAALSPAAAPPCAVCGEAEGGPHKMSCYPANRRAAAALPSSAPCATCGHSAQRHARSGGEDCGESNCECGRYVDAEPERECMCGEENCALARAGVHAWAKEASPAPEPNKCDPSYRSQALKWWCNAHRQWMDCQWPKEKPDPCPVSEPDLRAKAEKLACPWHDESVRQRAVDAIHDALLRADAAATERERERAAQEVEAFGLANDEATERVCSYVAAAIRNPPEET